MRSFFLFIDRLDRAYRILIAFFIGLVIYFIAFKENSKALAILYAWIGFAFITLAFSWLTILLRHPKQISIVAKEQDTSFWIIFLLVVSAAFISLFGIFLFLQGLPTFSKRGLSTHIVLSLIGVVLSWLLIHTLFTIRYAHLYYKASGDPKNPYAGGLEIPGTTTPAFLDFAYFSFVLGMTFQTADVSITGRLIRRLALLHGFLSFVYNTGIIALSINVISGVIGK